MRSSDIIAWQAFFSHTTCYWENKGWKKALFNIQNSGVVISFLPEFVQFIASFKCFVFMALSVWIKNPYIEKCPLSTTSKLSCTDISSCYHWYVSSSSPVRGCNSNSILTSFVTSSNISPILSRNSLRLKVTNPPF